MGLTQSKATARRRKEVIDLETGAAGDDVGRLPGAGMTKEYTGWDVYNNEAKKVDTELVNDWRENLNSLLLFAAIFAAVLTAFIIESKKMLELDPTWVIMDVMIFYTNNMANGNHTVYTPSAFEPDSWAVTVNSLFFASLSTSLVAALASVVSLQWVGDYDAAITRGGSSPEGRAKRRQFRYAGVVWWKMGELIAALPLLLYCSVVLFSVDSLYGRGKLLRIPVIPAWLERRQLNSAISRRREDLEVETRAEMGLAALVWLANELSISQDSYDRLLLLASELLKLRREVTSFAGSLEAPWYLMFDLLGWKNLKNNQDEPVTAQDIHAFTILAQCYRLPEIKEITAPINVVQYMDDAGNDEYWSQYCNLSRAQWSPKHSPSRPNSLFLLFRDIPLPPTDSVNNIEATIRLSRWRNSPQMLLSPSKGSWDQIAAYLMAHPETSTSPFILRLQGSLWSTIPNREDLCSRALKDPELFRMFEHSITCTQHHHFDGHILLHLFEWLPSIRVSMDMTAFTKVPITRRAVHVLLWMVITPENQYGLYLDNLRGQVHEECLARALEIGRELRASQYCMLSFISNLPSQLIARDANGRVICSEELAGLSIAVTNALDLPSDQKAAQIIPKLIYGIREVKSLMYYRQYRPEWENQAADREGTIVVQKLERLLASMRILASENIRRVTCARGQGGHSPAVGWLPMHLD